MLKTILAETLGQLIGGLRFCLAPELPSTIPPAAAVARDLLISNECKRVEQLEAGSK